MESLIEIVEVDSRLGLAASLRHDLDISNMALSIGGLSTEHHAVFSIKDGVGKITTLSTSGARILNHGLKHLGGSDDRLFSNVGLMDLPFSGPRRPSWEAFPYHYHHEQLWYHW